MKKLMIAALVAACAASTSQAGLLSKIAYAITGKTAAVTVVSSSAQTLDVETVDLMSLNEKEFEQVASKANSKALRKSLVARLGRLVEEWKAPKLLRPVKEATLTVLRALSRAERWADSHWKNYVVPTLRNAWTSIREFFGGIGK